MKKRDNHIKNQSLASTHHLIIILYKLSSHPTQKIMKMTHKLPTSFNGFKIFLMCTFFLWLRGTVRAWVDANRDEEKKIIWWLIAQDQLEFRIIFLLTEPEHTAYGENLLKPNMWSIQGHFLKIYILQCGYTIRKKLKISWFWKVYFEYKIIFLSESCWSEVHITPQNINLRKHLLR